MAYKKSLRRTAKQRWWHTIRRSASDQRQPFTAFLDASFLDRLAACTMRWTRRQFSEQLFPDSVRNLARFQGFSINLDADLVTRQCRSEGGGIK
jgi:hypothetical protein